MTVIVKRLLLSELMFVLVGVGLWLVQTFLVNLDPEWDLLLVGFAIFYVPGLAWMALSPRGRRLSSESWGPPHQMSRAALAIKASWISGFVAVGLFALGFGNVLSVVGLAVATASVFSLSSAILGRTIDQEKKKSLFCPHCHRRLGLDDVPAVESMALTCPNCHAQVRGDEVVERPW